MEVRNKYIKTYNELSELIAERIYRGLYVALGYSSNLDVLCDFQTSILNELLKRYLPNADITAMKAVKEITRMEEFLETLVYFCSRGIGGEVDISDFSIIKDTFITKNGIGGTGVQGALALAAVGCPSIVHLTDYSKEVCDMLVSPYIHTVSRDGELIHTDKVEQTNEQEIHYIIQYKKGDMIKLGQKVVTIPLSNRLIITKITVNKTLPLSKEYFSYVEEHACNITSNVLSGFNCILDKKLLEERLEFIKSHISRYKVNNPGGIVYFEDAHYHDEEVKKLCLEMLCPYVDILSMNEEELDCTLKMYGFSVDIEDIFSCIDGMEYIRNMFKIGKGVIVHTKDYAMYVGNELKADIEKGLIIGNMLATAKAMNGWYGSKEQIEEVLKLPLSEKGMKFRKAIEKAKLKEKVVLVPSKYIDKPKYTIGLGDSFVAGVQISFV